MKKDLTKQIYKDSGWQIDKDTKTTDYKPAPYCIFGEANAGKVPVGTEDGLIEFKDYNGGSPTPTELPIAYYETYDASKIIEGYLAYFNSGVNRGLWYKNQNGQTKKVFTIGEYPEGYITGITTGNNGINFARQDLPTITYKPEIYKHNVAIKSTLANEFILIEVFLNTTTPPSIYDLLANRQVKWELGLQASHIVVGEDWNVTSCRFRTDGTTFTILEGTTRTTWNAAECIITADNVINLLEVAEEI